jgi:hypothetical protein
MAFATALFSAIAAIPGILGYIKQITLWMNEQIVCFEKKKAAQEFKDAVASAKKTKDGASIDRMFK